MVFDAAVVLLLSVCAKPSVACVLKVWSMQSMLVVRVLLDQVSSRVE